MSTGRNLNRPAQDDRAALGNLKRRKTGKIAVGPRHPPGNPLNPPPAKPIEIPEQSRLRGPQYAEPLELARQFDAAQAESSRLPVRNLTTKFSFPNPGANGRDKQERRPGNFASTRKSTIQNRPPTRLQNTGFKSALGAPRTPMFNEDGSRNRARDINNGVNRRNGVEATTRRPAEPPEPFTAGKWLYSEASVSSVQRDVNQGVPEEIHPWPKPIMPFNVLARSARKIAARHVPSSANRPSVRSARRVVADSSDSEREHRSASDPDLPKKDEKPANIPSNELLEHMKEALSPRIYSKNKVPFLHRNLKAGFRTRCELQQGISGIPPRNCPGVSVLYSIMDENRNQRHRFEGYISSWICPLCRLLGELRTREELEFHLKHDHGEFECTWTKRPDATIQLQISSPEIPESESETEEEDQLDSSSDEDVLEVQQFLHARRQSTPPLLIDDAIEEDVKPFLRGSSVAHTRRQTTPLREDTQARQNGQTREVPSARPPRPPDAACPPVFLSNSAGGAAGRRTAKGKSVDRNRDDSSTREDTPSTHRYPTPPPYSNLEGPSAIYPYLPSDQYSARPGGPKLYDLLNTLSLEPFGLMSWFIVEKEEDIYELDDIRDEDKVMQALWSRWILLNRNKFVENYLLGMKEFIDEYWPIIHRAAGFAALRVWLLVFVSNRFLTGTDFCDLLKYYSDLVGINLWK